MIRITSTVALAIVLTGCGVPDYTVKEGLPKASVFLQDGPSLKSWMYISRDSAKCTNLVSLETQITQRAPYSLVGPYSIESNVPLASHIRGIHSQGLTETTTCDVIFTNTFESSHYYLIKLVESSRTCGVLVYEANDSGLPLSTQPMNVNYRKYTQPMFMGSTACTD
ncbi:hypothetical protein LYSHEL_27000 [Lysobacter helvus]|uniref:Lipoprotein n=2 Tax=Lysobacteraceae TaxID=32033 RepID=A0ABM7Q8E0_9GAMM|nr:hypothetical protein LYSCAS_26970 [Lysobacter caseinilyticus]BCT96829.1 hypothetical protein LYSHEL_27000 [Lysobacter helvus]